MTVTVKGSTFARLHHANALQVIAEGLRGTPWAGPVEKVARHAVDWELIELEIQDVDEKIREVLRVGKGE